jgi:regulator of protease activity HflC (stomatin/prohibitin superfamily)
MNLLFQFLWSIMGLLQCWTVVDQYERGVILRLGKYKRTIEPGFHWLIPLGFDRALTHEVILTTRETDEQSLVTSDGKKVVISSMIAYTLTDIKKILLEIEEAETVLENFVYGEITKIVSESDYDYILDHDGFLTELTENVTIQAATLGMKIHKVVIVNFSEIKTIRLLIPTQDVVVE